jgi:hypothetical protein
MLALSHKDRILCHFVEDPLALLLSRVGSSEFILEEFIAQIHDNPELNAFETKDMATG